MANPLDDIYNSSKLDYKDLRAKLEIINSELVNTEANIYYDSSNTSYLSANRKDKLTGNLPKNYRKDHYYGIVLYKTGYLDKEVYIDVPGKSPPIFNPSLFYIKDIDLTLYQEYLFEVEGLDFFSNPKVGGIAVVKLPDNYPNHIHTNPQDAIYTGMYRKEILVDIDTSGKRVENSNNNGLNTQNSAETSNPNLSLREKRIEKQSNDALNSYKDIKKYNKITDEIEDAISFASSVTGVEKTWIKAFISTESKFNPSARSPAGAMGLMQIMPKTVGDLSKKKLFKEYYLNKKVNPYDIKQNILMGSIYLEELKGRFKNISAVAGAYNSGPNLRVDGKKSPYLYSQDNFLDILESKAIKQVSLQETLVYIPRINKFYELYTQEQAVASR